MKEKNKRFFKNLFAKVKSLLPIFFVSGVIIVLLYASTLWKVKRIECSTEYGPCIESLKETFNPLIGKNLILTGRDDVKNVVKDRLEVHRVRIRKKLPETLIVDVEIAKARVAVPQEGKFKLLDLTGNIVGEGEDSTLPKLNVIPTLAEISENDVKWAVETLYYLDVLGFDVNAAFDNGGMVVDVNGTEVVLAKSREPTLAAGSLQFMMTRFKMEGKSPVKIDLRFKNPIVTF